MKNFVYIILIGLMINSCDKKDCCTEVNTRVDIKYINSDGHNILGIDGGIDTSKIKLFYKKSNEWKEFYQVNLDHPRGYFVSNERGENYLYLFPSDYYFGNDISETKIQLSDEEFDIIRCQYSIGDNSIICTKVWYNDVLKWEGDGNQERIIEILK